MITDNTFFGGRVVLLITHNMCFSGEIRNENFIDNSYPWLFIKCQTHRIWFGVKIQKSSKIHSYPSPAEPGYAVSLQCRSRSVGFSN